MRRARPNARAACSADAESRVNRRGAARSESRSDRRGDARN